MDAETKRPRGRPFTEKGRRSESIKVILHADEKAEIKRRAAAAGESVAAYLRRRALE